MSWAAGPSSICPSRIDEMREDQDSAIARALDAFQALLKSKHVVNPTENRALIAAARAELLQIRNQRTLAASEASRQPQLINGSSRG